MRVIPPVSRRITEYAVVSVAAIGMFTWYHDVPRCNTPVAVAVAVVQSLSTRCKLAAKAGPSHFGYVQQCAWRMQQILVRQSGYCIVYVDLISPLLSQACLMTQLKVYAPSGL